MRKALLLAVSLALVLGLLEGLLRIVYPTGLPATIPALSALPWVRYDAVLGWRNEPGDPFGDGRLVINGDGMRGPGPTQPKPQKTVRVLCLGDSRTFGSWSDVLREFESEYAPTLRTRAEAEGVGAEILNAAVAGYTSAHVLRQLNTQVPAWQPDVVVVAVGFNDLLLAWDAGFRMREPPGAWLRTLFYRVADWRLMQVALRGGQLAPWRPDPLTRPWATPEEYRTNLRRTAETARAQGIELLFLHLPLRRLELGGLVPRPGVKHDPGELLEAVAGTRDLAVIHAAYQRYRQVLGEVAEAEAVPLLDLGPDFAAEPPGSLFGIYDFVHYNPAGAALVGERVFSELRRLGWLAGRAGE